MLNLSIATFMVSLIAFGIPSLLFGILIPTIFPRAYKESRPMYFSSLVSIAGMFIGWPVSVLIWYFY